MVHHIMTTLSNRGSASIGRPGLASHDLPLSQIQARAAIAPPTQIEPGEPIISPSSQLCVNSEHKTPNQQTLLGEPGPTTSSPNHTTGARRRYYPNFRFILASKSFKKIHLAHMMSEYHMFGRTWLGEPDATLPNINMAPAMAPQPAVKRQSSALRETAFATFDRAWPADRHRITSDTSNV